MGKNAFEDVGFTKPEAVTLQARVALALAVERFVKAQRWTQAKAAAAFKVPQPTISKILRGNVEKLSVEYLLRMLAQVGVPVRMVTGGTRSARRRVA